MKVKDLLETLCRVREIESEIEDAELSLSHGGSVETMRFKQDRLDDARQRYENIQEEEI